MRTENTGNTQCVPLSSDIPLFQFQCYCVPSTERMEYWNRKTNNVYCSYFAVQEVQYTTLGALQIILDHNVILSCQREGSGASCQRIALASFPGSALRMTFDPPERESLVLNDIKAKEKVERTQFRPFRRAHALSCFYAFSIYVEQSYGRLTYTEKFGSLREDIPFRLPVTRFKGSTFLLWSYYAYN